MNLQAQRASLLILDRDLNQPVMKVLPGQYHVATDHTVMLTVLGSCVAACLRDPGNHISGMNHFMLPSARDAASRSGARNMRFGDCAMDGLIEELCAMGARRAHLVAKVFGGAHLIGGPESAQIGASNVRFVHDYLSGHGITVEAEDLLGCWGRRLAFFPATGVALVKRVHI